MMFLHKSSVQVQKLGLKPRPPPAPQSTMRPNSIGIGFCILLCSRKKSFRNQFITCQPPILNSESMNIFSQNIIFVFGGSKWVFGGNNSCFLYFRWSQSKILPHRKTKQHRICSSKKERRFRNQDWWLTSSEPVIALHQRFKENNFGEKNKCRILKKKI